MPGRREAHAMAGVALAIGVILCAVSVLLGFEGRAFLGRPPGGDFVEFYTIGKILNNYPPARIYDPQLAVALQHATVPAMPQTQMLVFGQAPFIASLFRPFALLPYAWAYLAWLGFSAALYMAALAVLFRTVGLNAKDRRTGFLLAMSLTSFLFETWIGGQVSVVVFVIWALFFWCHEKRWPFLGGCILALCLFKPTLVALPALMLLVGRRWRVVGGLVAGGVAMAALSVATVGLDGCMAWLRGLLMFGNTVATTGQHWNRAKDAGILAFFEQLLGNRTPVAVVIATLVAIAALSWLGRAWWRSEGQSGDRALWAATLCFTLVISPYAPIYDTILVVVAVVLIAPQVSALWLLILYMIPWVTQSFAEFLHLQLMTVSIAGFGIWAVLLSERRSEIAGTTSVSHSKPRQEESTMTGAVQRWATGRFQVRSRGLP
ncbi:MAG TPA: glycosyltransferase family 87 protein [Bryobacteraceae bacterium]|nr:glycosyltransferase family 87 protein [Bryobacteraceae bacterium]